MGKNSWQNFVWIWSRAPKMKSIRWKLFYLYYTCVCMGFNQILNNRCNNSWNQMTWHLPLQWLTNVYIVWSTTSFGRWLGCHLLSGQTTFLFPRNSICSQVLKLLDYAKWLVGLVLIWWSNSHLLLALSSSTNGI